MKYYSENRKFQVWDFTVSHGMLLIRSPGEGDESTIDLVFHGTKFFSLPKDIGEISVDLVSGESSEALMRLWPRFLGKDEAFVIKSASDEMSYFVVAAGVRMTEHHNGIFWNAFGDL